MISLIQYGFHLCCYVKKNIFKPFCPELKINVLNSKGLIYL